MAVDYDKLLNYPIPEVRHRYSRNDSILYALGVGLGSDPVDPRQLAYVYEEGLRTFPTFPVVLGHPGFWWKNADTGVDWARVLHGEQGLVIHELPPVEGEVIGRTRITQIIDKGPDKGLVVYSERTITDARSGALYATLPNTTLLRGDGGVGGPSGPVPPVEGVPARDPDASITLQTLPQQALIYRLSGDFNPLHADPAVARAVRFDRPILHGLCSLGVAAHALMQTLDYDSSRFAGLKARFTAPVYPGESLVTDIWREAGFLAFRSRVPTRNVVALNNGRVDLRS